MQFGSNIVHGVTLEKLYFDTAGFVYKNAGQSPKVVHKTWRCSVLSEKVRYYCKNPGSPD